MIKVYSIDFVPIFDRHSKLVEHKDVIIGAIQQVKEIFAFYPISVYILPVSCDAVLIRTSILCFVFADDNQGVSVERFLELVGSLDTKDFNICYGDAPCIVQLVRTKAT